MPYATVLNGTAPVKLADQSTDKKGGLSKDEGIEAAEALGKEFAELEDLLFYAGEHALLIVFQGRDTSGKDGAIRKILDFSNAQSIRVAPFKVPTEMEQSHDFLWRIHQKVPARGEVVIFNRSHYEDVLIARVHKLVPKEVWKRRYTSIRHFEKLLLDNRTILAKIFLNISKDEQEKRLLAREEETEKAWKLSVGDWKERENWDDYTQAYEDALNECATPEAPWHVIPADHKWYRNLAVAEILVEALRPYRKDWLRSLEELGAERKAELAKFRK